MTFRRLIWLFAAVTWWGVSGSATAQDESLPAEDGATETVAEETDVVIDLDGDNASEGETEMIDLDMEADTAPSEPSTPAPTSTSTAGSSGKGAQSMAQFESVRRQEMAFMANQAIEDGNRLLEAGEIDSAIARYKYAVDNLQPVGEGAPAYQRAAYGLSAALVYKAHAALKDDRIPEAVELYEQAKYYNPSNEKIIKQLAYARRQLKQYEVEGTRRASLRNNPAWNPEFKQRVATVQQFFWEGERYMDTGQYDRAEDRYKRILALDPYNTTARKKLTHLEKLRHNFYNEMRQTTRQEAMYQVTEEWQQKVPFDFGRETTGPGTTQSSQSNLSRMIDKLNSIVIPRLIFNQLDVEQAVLFLSEKSRELDPEGQGVNFVLKLDRTTGNLASAEDGGADADDKVVRSVTLDLEQIPLIQAIQFLSDVTNLQVKIEEYAVYLLPTNDAPAVLTIQTYDVPAGFFSTAIEAEASPPGSTATTRVSDVEVDVKQELIDKGVSFDVAGSTAAYLRGAARLVVKNTPDQLDLIDALLSQVNQEQPQVEIQTKFAEFTDDALKALTVNYYLAAQNSILPALTAGGYNPAVPLGNTTFTVEGQSQLRTPATIPNNTSVVNGVVQGPGGLTPNSLDAVLAQNSIASQNNAVAPQNFILGGPLTTNSFNTISIGGVIDGHGFTAIINAVDNLKGVDLMTAPKVTAKNRTTATIEVIRELRYPSEFERPTVSGTQFGIINVPLNPLDDPFISEVFVALPATPREFEVRNIGVTLNVTPTTYPDQRIDLDVTPEVVDFEGFVNYGQPITQRTNNLNPQLEAPAIINGIVNQPVFNLRTLSTKLQVLDGQTIIMGGLIREDRQVINDKIPMLGDLPMIGRMFQSKIEKSFKRNLMIFVTARLIKSDGSPLYSRDLFADENPTYDVADGLSPYADEFADMGPKSMDNYYDNKNFGSK